MELYVLLICLPIFGQVRLHKLSISLTSIIHPVETYQGMTFPFELAGLLYCGSLW